MHNKRQQALRALTLRSRSMAFFFLSSESSLAGTFLCCSVLSVYEVQVGNPTMFLANIDTEEDNGPTTITPGIAVDGSGAAEPTPSASFPASSCCGTRTPSVVWIQDNWWQSAQLLSTYSQVTVLWNTHIFYTFSSQLEYLVDMTCCNGMPSDILSPNVVRQNYHLLAVRIGINKCDKHKNYT